MLTGKMSWLQFSKLVTSAWLFAKCNKLGELSQLQQLTVWGWSMELKGCWSPFCFKEKCDCNLSWWHLLDWQFDLHFLPDAFIHLVATPIVSFCFTFLSFESVGTTTSVWHIFPVCDVFIAQAPCLWLLCSIVLSGAKLVDQTGHAKHTTAWPLDRHLTISCSAQFPMLVTCRSTAKKNEEVTACC